MEPKTKTNNTLTYESKVPIKPLSQSLSLPTHTLDTFASWTPPLPNNKPINLIIAVSFGLFIPANLLQNTTYGGLNIHPSLLPDFRGPAPLHRTLLADRQTSGVSLQTLSQVAFDRGTVLKREEVAVPAEGTVESLLQVLGPMGAEILCKSIEEGIFVPPVQSVVAKDSQSGQGLVHAAKITPEDRKVDWSRWSSEELIKRDRVLGRLWDDVVYDKRFMRRPGEPDSRKRIVYQGPWKVVEGEYNEQLVRLTEPLVVFKKSAAEPEARLALLAADGKMVAPASVTVDGGQKGKGLGDVVEFKQFAELANRTVMKSE